MKYVVKRNLQKEMKKSEMPTTTRHTLNTAYRQLVCVKGFTHIGRARMDGDLHERSPNACLDMSLNDRSQPLLSLLWNNYDRRHGISTHGNNANISFLRSKRISTMSPLRKSGSLPYFFFKIIPLNHQTCLLKNYR